MEDMNETLSEFGKGFAYCLGLFLAHAEAHHWRDQHWMWFNAAFDHLREIETSSDLLGEEVSMLTKELVDFCYTRKNFSEDVTQEDIAKAIALAKHILFLWDHQNGIYAIEGDWE